MLPGLSQALSAITANLNPYSLATIQFCLASPHPRIISLCLTSWRFFYNRTKIKKHESDRLSKGPGFPDEILIDLDSSFIMIKALIISVAIMSVLSQTPTASVFLWSLSAGFSGRCSSICPPAEQLFAFYQSLQKAIRSHTAAVMPTMWITSSEWACVSENVRPCLFACLPVHGLNA